MLGLDDIYWSFNSELIIHVDAMIIHLVRISFIFEVLFNAGSIREHNVVEIHRTLGIASSCVSGIVHLGLIDQQLVTTDIYVHKIQGLTMYDLSFCSPRQFQIVDHLVLEFFVRYGFVCIVFIIPNEDEPPSIRQQ